jgi:metal-responsive CopG/Arc/MetJ family transcriptional regulator
MIDEISKKRGISRSKLISNMLRQKIIDERDKQINEAYNQVFSDDSIQKEQLDTSIWFDGSGSKEGQEW